MKILIRAIVSFFVFIVDVVYGNRSYARFYVLETIARVPYFSYLSVLHLYETLGFWRKADLLKVHFAETWNELHHLLIMESLGEGVATGAIASLPNILPSLTTGSL
jgi:ubiquinol oxidase